jgi:hypothetical protein
VRLALCGAVWKAVVSYGRRPELQTFGGRLPIAESTIVARAREPVSGPQVVGVLAGLGVGVAANLAIGDVGVTSWALALVVAAFVVLPLATLGHELGHALAVSLLAQRPSLVVVGRGPFLRIKADPALVLFSVMPTRGVPFSGICRYDPSGLSWRTIAYVALAGPLASLCELIALALSVPLLWSTGPTMRLLMFLTAACLITSIAANLWPNGATPADHDRSFRRDGPMAHLAYSRYQAGAPLLAIKSPVDRDGSDPPEGAPSGIRPKREP